MEELLKRIRNTNKEYNDLPRKIYLTVLVFSAIFLLIKIIPLFLPFVIGLLFAAIMLPPVNFLTCKIKRCKIKRSIATLLAMVIIYGIITFLLFMTFRQLFIEVKKLSINLPSTLDWVEKTLTEWGNRFLPASADAIVQKDLLTSSLNTLSNSILVFFKGLLNRITPVVASGAWTTVTSIPQILLTLVMTVMASYYFTSDKTKILDYFTHALPSPIFNQVKRLKNNIGHAIVQQIKAQIFVSLAIMVALVIGFIIIGIDYALLLGICIGFLDVLPIIGAGTFLIPWAVFNLFAGNLPLGIGLVINYLVVVIIRQIIEPKIVGNQLGLYPLVSMVSMFIGLRLLGFLGLIIGPVAANICKVVLENDAEIRRQQRAAQGSEVKG